MRQRANGTVNTESGSLRRLRWKEVINTTTVDNNPKRLVGYGFMGALAAGDARLGIGPYLRDLRAHNVNFTRVWAIESWTGQASSSSEGPTPFAGTLAGDYNLDQDSPIFYDRLRRFAQEAADRGIVVQLSLFDKHGLICPDNPGAYFHSPYKDGNNVEAQNYMDDTWQGCSCTALSGGDGPGNLLAQNCHPLRMFLGQGNTTKELALRALHARYLRRVGEEVGGVGNMIFEVINEALEPQGGNPGDWPEAFGTSTRNQVWQKSIVDDMRLSLRSTVRTAPTSCGTPSTARRRTRSRSTGGPRTSRTRRGLPATRSFCKSPWRATRIRIPSVPIGSSAT